MQSTALVRPPRPLDEGKGAWQCFAACCSFFPLLKKLGHGGISISQYCFDRALHSALQKKLRQRHALYHELQAGGGAKSGKVAMDDLCDWV
eukprot:4291418-Alexandrium_andersonii.AAC.1